METYNLIADLLDTYQSLPDFLKVIWVILPPGFVLGLIAVLRLKAPPPIQPDYNFFRTETGLYIALPNPEKMQEIISPEIGRIKEERTKLI